LRRCNHKLKSSQEQTKNRLAPSSSNEACGSEQQLVMLKTSTTGTRGCHRTKDR
jgi:hypothetical protein